MEAPKKIMAWVDVKEKQNQSLSRIEELISFITVCQWPTETNGKYLDRFNYQLQKLDTIRGKTHSVQFENHG